MLTKQVHCASTVYTKFEKVRCQRLPLSERGLYPKNNLRTCFLHLNNCVIFYSSKKNWVCTVNPYISLFILYNDITYLMNKSLFERTVTYGMIVLITIKWLLAYVSIYWEMIKKHSCFFWKGLFQLKVSVTPEHRKNFECN